MPLEVGPLSPHHHADAFALRVEAFGDAMARGTFDPAAPYVPDDRRVGVVEDGRLVGQLAMWPFGQQVGGRVVPMAGVAGVAVTRTHRGRGVGSLLLGAALDRMRELGDVVSTLYPATVAPYAAWGWALGGHHELRSVATRTLLDVPAPTTGVRVRPATPDDLEPMAAVARTVASTEPGGLVGDDTWYRRTLLVDPDDDEEPGVDVAERDGEVVGFCRWEREPAGPDVLGAALTVWGVVGLDADVERALWRTVGGWWSVAPTVRFVSWPTDPLLADLPELDTRVVFEETWMTRLVDVAGAMAARGWPDGVTATVPLRVRDHRVPANDGAFVLEVADGEAALTSGGGGRVEVDVTDLARLWVGAAPATVLGRRGALGAATDADVAALARAFDTPTPYLREYF